MWCVLLMFEISFSPRRLNLTSRQIFAVDLDQEMLDTDFSPNEYVPLKACHVCVYLDSDDVDHRALRARFA